MGILNSKVASVFTLLAGVALVGVSTDLVTVVAPDSVREVHAYETAPPCPAAPSEPAECRWTEEFTASDVRFVRNYQRGDRSAVLIGASGARWYTGYDRSDPVLDQLHDGDRVTGTIWRGHLTEIAAKGATQDTEKAPDDARAFSSSTALVLTSSGLALILASAWRLLRRRAAPTPAMEAVFVLSIALLMVGFLSACVVFAIGDFLLLSVVENAWLFAAIFVPAAAGLVVKTRRDLKKPRTPGLPGVPI